MNDASEILAGLAEEFTARVRAGELPTIEEYAARRADLAERVRALFPTLLLLEGMARGGVGEPASGVDLSPGAVFGPYTIVREIGRGGMGIVYEAIHQALQRRVALKVLPVSAAQGSTQLERFLREARTAASLHHTHIVPVFDVGQVQGVPFYAMQLIHGQGLDAVLASGSRRAVPTGADYYRWVAELGVQAADALSFAHQRGVIHRDIKPSNLLLDDEGVLWVTDFGLARMDGDAGLTHAGQLVGTPRYMSPEQAGAAAKPIDHRSDLYSLGATLYELLTRRPPVEGTTPQEVLQALLLREPVAPRRLNPKIPRDLETILLKTMSRQPEDRYASAEALANDLRRFLDHRPLAARRLGLAGKTLRWAKRNPAVAGLSLALLLSFLTFSLISTANAHRARDEEHRARHAEMQAREAFYRASIAQAQSDQREAQRMIDQGLAYAERGDLVSALHWFARPIAQHPQSAEGDTFNRQRLATFDRYGILPQPLGVFAHADERILAVHPDGKSLLRGGAKDLELIDVATARVQRRFASGATQAAIFDGGKSTVALQSGDGAALVIFDTTDGTEKLRLTLPFALKESLLDEGNGAAILLAADGKEVAVCRPGDAKPAWVRQTVMGDLAIEGISTGPAGELYLVGRDHRVETRDLATLKRQKEQRWEGGTRVFRVQALAGQERLLTLERKSPRAANASIWLPNFPHQLAEIPVGLPQALALRGDGQRLFAGGSTSALWDLDGQLLLRWPEERAVVGARFLNQGRWLLVEDADLSLLWDFPDNQPPGQAILADRERRVSAASLPAEGDSALVLHVAPNARAPIHRLEHFDGKGKPVHEFSLHDRHNHWFATHNGRFLVTHPDDASKITIYNVSSGEVMAEVQRRAVKQARLCLSEDGQTLLRFVREARAIEVIDVPSGRVERTLKVGGQAAARKGGFDLTMSADGQSAVSLLDGRVEMWRLDQSGAMPGAAGADQWSRVVPEATSVALNPEPWSQVPGGIGGDTLVIGEPSGLRLWEAGFGEPRTPILPGTAEGWVGSWDRDSQRVALVLGKAVVVHETGTGRPITPALTHPANVVAARLVADGLSLSTLDEMGQRRVWDLSPETTTVGLLEKIEQRTGYRMDDTGRVVSLVDEPGRR